MPLECTAPVRGLRTACPSRQLQGRSSIARCAVLAGMMGGGMMGGSGGMMGGKAPKKCTLPTLKATIAGVMKACCPGGKCSPLPPRCSPSCLKAVDGFSSSCGLSLAQAVRPPDQYDEMSKLPLLGPVGAKRNDRLAPR